MPKVTFIKSDATPIEVEVPVGTSLMRAATLNDIDGITADCGGEAACATCHVLVQEEYLSKLPEPTRNENEMLECTAMHRAPNSRLSCQVVMAEELAGLTVRIAFPQ